jgi:hypothetical protein
VIRRISQGISLAVVLIGLIDCENDGGPNADVISSLSLGASTNEREPGRALLVVGDTGLASVNAEKENDCFLNGPPCAASVEVQLRSRPDGLIAVSQQRVTTPGQSRFIGIAPGSAYVVAQHGGRADSQRVDVVAAPLPVDSIRVTAQQSPFDESVSATEDPSGNLVELTLPHPASTPLLTRVFRGTIEVIEIPWTIQSSDPAIVAANKGCRPVTIDPNCDVVSRWGWVTGLAPGNATVTVSVRNVQKSFSVVVQ